jgi:hypothetical protein
MQGVSKLYAGGIKIVCRGYQNCMQGVSKLYAGGYQNCMQALYYYSTLATLLRNLNINVF